MHWQMPPVRSLLSPPVPVPRLSSKNSSLRLDWLSSTQLDLLPDSFGDPAWVACGRFSAGSRWLRPQTAGEGCTMAQRSPARTAAPTACRIRANPAAPIVRNVPAGNALHRRPPMPQETSHPYRRRRRWIAAVLLGPRLPYGVVRSRGPVPPEEIEAHAQGKKNGDGCHEQPSPEHTERQRFVRTHPNLRAVVRGRNPRATPSPASATPTADYHSWITVRIRIATSGKGRNANAQRSFVSKRRCM